MISVREKNRSQGGQVAVFLSIIFPILILLLAFVVNISLLVHQKIRIQNAVDAGVYSAAASFARDLDRIALYNDDIDRMWHGDPANFNLYDSNEWPRSFEAQISNTVFNGLDGPGSARSFVDKYQYHYRQIIDRIEEISEGAFEKAIYFGTLATRLTYYNGRESLVMSNPSNVNFESLFDSASGDTGFMDYSEFTKPQTLDYATIGPDCPAPTMDSSCGPAKLENVPINLPISKNNLIVFVGKAAADPAFSPIASGIFATGNEWRLTAFAAGQPYSGSVEDLSARYKASLVKLENRIVDEYGEFYH